MLWPCVAELMKAGQQQSEDDNCAGLVCGSGVKRDLREQGQDAKTDLEKHKKGQ